MPQAPTVDLPKRLPLVVTLANRDSSTAKDAKLVNCYIEKGQDGDTRIFKRPGMAKRSQPPGIAAAGLGSYNWNGNVYSVFGNKLYKNAAAIAGTVNTAGGVYRFDSCLGSVPRLQLGNGVSAYNYDDVNGLVQIATTSTTTAGAFTVGVQYTILVAGSTDFTLIGAVNSTPGTVFTSTGVGVGTGTATSANFPTNFVKGWANLDSTSYVMQSDASILGSSMDALGTIPDVWPPLNKTIARIDPDGGVALSKQLSYVVAFKQWTTEVFYDANNPVPGSPLGPAQGMRVNWGCAHADSIQSIDGMLIWLATSRSSAIVVVLMDQLKAVKVSTAPIERLLDKLDLGTIYSWNHKDQGHRFYIVTSKVSNLTLAYDIDEQMWHQWTDTNGNYVPIVASTWISPDEHLVQHESDGYLYTLDEGNYTDAGDTITVDIITPNFDGGTRRRKMMNFMEFIGDQVTGSTLLVRISDDDYQTWSNFRTVDLGSPRPFLTDCGTFTRRAYNFRHQSNTAMRLQAVDMQLDLGTL